MCANPAALILVETRSSALPAINEVKLVAPPSVDTYHLASCEQHRLCFCRVQGKGRSCILSEEFR